MGNGGLLNNTNTDGYRRIRPLVPVRFRRTGFTAWPTIANKTVEIDFQRHHGNATLRCRTRRVTSRDRRPSVPLTRPKAGRSLCLLRVSISGGTLPLNYGSVRPARQESEETMTAITSEFEQRMKHIRAGIRLNSRVAVAVEWTEDGKSHRTEGYTVDISPKGCLAI